MMCQIELPLTLGLFVRRDIWKTFSPEPLLIKDIKVQVNKQKPNNVRSAQMKNNSDKMTIAPTSSPLAAIPMLHAVFAYCSLLP